MQARALCGPGMSRLRAGLDRRPAFADNSHAAYYSSRVTCGAGSGGGKPGKAPKAGRSGAGRLRVLQLAREADAVLAGLEQQRPAGLQAHPLDRWGSMSSSESESESDAEAAQLPGSSGRLAATQTRQRQAQVAVCTGKSCSRRSSGAVLAEFQAATAGTSIGVSACSKCLGQCKLGPAVRTTAPDGKVTIVTGVTIGVAPAVLANTLLAGAFYCPVPSPAAYSS